MENDTGRSHWMIVRSIPKQVFLKCVIYYKVSTYSQIDFDWI